MQRLTVIHRKKPGLFSEVPSGWRIFVTCLRSVALSFTDTEDERPQILDNDEVLTGETAYRFLLAVACGLESPITGETEVFGQFRDFAETWTERAGFFQSVFADVKSVRHAHLSNLGSQSYGSWVRKNVIKSAPVHIVGTGQLAQEILIWLKKQHADICLYSRDPKTAAQRLEKALGETMNGVLLRSLATDLEVEGASLVIAAPVSGVELKTQMRGAPALFIDLRDNSDTDHIAAAKAYRLADVFSEIASGRKNSEQQTDLAREMIREMAKQRFSSQILRPFGWDDLCA